MKNWRVWTALFAVFIAGIVVGILGLGLVIRQHFGPPRDFDKAQAAIHQRFLDDFMEKVQPAPQAMPAIKHEIDMTFKKLEELRQETHPRLKAILEKSTQTIKDHLTAEQGERFEKMLRDHRKGKFGFLPPPPPPIP